MLIVATINQLGGLVDPSGVQYALRYMKIRLNSKQIVEADTKRAQVLYF